MTAKEAIQKFVRDDMLLHLGGFGHLYPYSLTHELIRQRKKNLTICKHSPELLADQLIGAGCVRKLLFGYISNPRVGPAHCFERSLRDGTPTRIEIEEYSHHGLGVRLRAGAYGLPFLPTKTMLASDVEKINSNIRTVTCPFTGTQLVALPSINPDVSLIHVQRVDEFGNAQAWGILGDLLEGAMASKIVLVSAEEIVAEEMIQSDPNRTIIPGFRVSAVVEESWGAHPSYAQGYYDRDNDYYFLYEASTRSAEGFYDWRKEWIDNVENRAEYVKKLGSERISKLKPGHRLSPSIDYGDYR
jgi:glutaconate CoA-transferase subunit A